MAAKKGKKKGNKAAKKAKKAAKKAAKRAAKRAKKAPRKAAKARKATKAAKKATRKAPAHKARQQPESLRLHSAGPSFTVNDLQKSVAFYRDVLGFIQMDKWEEDGVLTGVELVAGSVRFWLGQDDWKKGRNRVKGEGFRMYCGTTQNIDALAARVRSTGNALAEEPKDQSWGGRTFAVRDPDGFVITISSGL